MANFVLARASKAAWILAIVVVVACQSEEQSQEIAPPETSSLIEPTETIALEPDTGQPSALKPTALQPTATNTSIPTSASALVQPTATPTIVPPTATPDFPPAAHINVDAAPYAPSECSPDYPCNDDIAGWESRLRVPPGFNGTYFAHVGGRPTAMTAGPDGLLYVAVITGTIYTADEFGESQIFFEGLNTPTGMAFQPGTDNLYVSSRIKDDFVDGEGQISVIKDGAITTIINDLPCCYIGMHGPNGIAFGPDGYGYVGVGGRADHGEILFGPENGEQDELRPFEASILRFSPNGQSVESYAKGFRNPYDITWDASDRLYATDNGRDGNFDLGDQPPDELHEVNPGGEHGYPYYECANCFGIPDGVEIISPVHELIPHGAVAGITAYLNDEFPGYYDDLFLVLWSAFEGAQKVQRVGRNRSEISDFATGFAAPIDIVVGVDGNLYVADFATGIIFQIRYTGER
jgi:glucose/arabinose dehydrogenase